MKVCIPVNKTAQSNKFKGVFHVILFQSHSIANDEKIKVLVLPIYYPSGWTALKQMRTYRISCLVPLYRAWFPSMHTLIDTSEK